MSSAKTLVLRREPVPAIRFAGRAVPGVNRQKFDLIAFLALRRIEEPAAGYVDAEDILQLASWAGNNLSSVGKQISPYIARKLRPAGLAHLIEAAQVTKGPFRLGVPPDQIDAGGSLEELRESLGLGQLIAKLTEPQLKRFYAFVVCIWRGSKSLNEGDVAKASRQYRLAERNSVLPHHRILALCNRTRAMDRMGGENARRAVVEEARALLPKVQQDLDWASAKVFSMEGWLDLRSNDEAGASRCYAHALGHIGTRRNHQLGATVYNGLGLIARRQEQNQRALALYHQALECGVLAEDFYSIQASYFNIGQIYSIKADAFWKAGNPSTARNFYRSAAQWVKACMQLCEQLVIADDTSDDRILLSHIYRRLGDLNAAAGAATEARRMAERAQNQRCLALACYQLAAVEIERGNAADALRIIGEAKASLQKASLRYLREEKLLSALRSVQPNPR